MFSKRGTLLFALIAAASFGMAACEGAEEEPQEEPLAEEPLAEEPAADESMAGAGMLPEGVTPEMVAQGGDIFSGQGNCFTCHGQRGEGTALAPNLQDQEWLNIPEGSYEQIIQIVTNGVPTPVQHPAPMPPMGGAQLSEEQVRSVAAYVYSISQAGGAGGGQ